MCLTCTAVVAELLPLFSSGIVENSCSAGSKLIAFRNYALNHFRLYMGLPIAQSSLKLSAQDGGKQERKTGKVPDLLKQLSY